MRKPFTCYAVSRGRAIGVFDTWATCAASVRGFGPAARYPGFYSRQDAEDWLLDERAKLEEARRGRKIEFSGSRHESKIGFVGRWAGADRSGKGSACRRLPRYTVKCSTPSS